MVISKDYSNWEVFIYNLCIHKRTCESFIQHLGHLIFLSLLEKVDVWASAYKRAKKPEKQ